jgi:protein phosphatase PTC7
MRGKDVLVHTLLKWEATPTSFISDSPQDALTYTFNLQPGDIIVAATDGLWDNMQIAEILSIAEALSQRNKDPETFCVELARELVETAAKMSIDKRFLSPFAVKAHKWNKKYTGGKPDDITVVVGCTVVEK